MAVTWLLRDSFLAAGKGLVGREIFHDKHFDVGNSHHRTVFLEALLVGPVDGICSGLGFSGVSSGGGFLAVVFYYIENWLVLIQTHFFCIILPLILNSIIKGPTSNLNNNQPKH